MPAVAAVAAHSAKAAFAARAAIATVAAGSCRAACTTRDHAMVGDPDARTGNAAASAGRCSGTAIAAVLANLTIRARGASAGGIAAVTPMFSVFESFAVFAVPSMAPVRASFSLAARTARRPVKTFAAAPGGCTGDPGEGGARANRAVAGVVAAHTGRRRAGLGQQGERRRHRCKGSARCMTPRYAEDNRRTVHRSAPPELPRGALIQS